MTPRLIALWFSVGVLWLVSASCYAIGTEYYQVYRSQDIDIVVRPLIVRIFMTKHGWIYFYPAVFIISTLVLTWKVRGKGEWIWCFVAITLGTTVLFLGLFIMALEAGRLSDIPYLHEGSGP